MSLTKDIKNLLSLNNPQTRYKFKTEIERQENISYTKTLGGLALVKAAVVATTAASFNPTKKHQNVQIAIMASSKVVFINRRRQRK